MPMIFHHRVDLASAHTTFIVAALTAAGDLLLLAPLTVLISSCIHMSTLVSISKKLKYQVGTKIFLPLSPLSFFKLQGGIWSSAHLSGFPSQM